MEFEKDSHKVLFSADKISRRVAELGKDITAHYNGQTVTVMALTNGAIIFAADLVRQIKCPIQLDTFAIASYNDRTSSGELNIRSMPKLDVSGKHVLVVDDILDTGLTLHGVSSWLKKQGAADIKICVLLDKKVSERKVEISADWAGFEVPDVYVYGYGLDNNEFDRNLPFITEITD
jgi:hypoxanthine phosphoribosyltransferase